MKATVTTKEQPPLGTIDEEADLCRQAFAGSSVGDLVQHCHHERWIEILTEPAENRIQFILVEKTTAERAARLRLFRPLSPAIAKTFPPERQKAYAECQKLYAEYQKADAEYRKADAEYQKAYAEYRKAYAEWRKAYAEWRKADAERQKADAAWQKADAEWRKADAECQKAAAAWRKADAERQKAYAEYQKADAERSMLAVHAEICGCPWGKTTDIFGLPR